VTDAAELFVGEGQAEVLGVAAIELLNFVVELLGDGFARHSLGFAGERIEDASFGVGHTLLLRGFL